MSLISKTIAGLFNGISQQAVSMRRDTQGQRQVNCMGSLVDGLYKRPPTMHKHTIEGVDVRNSVGHTINRDVSERYQIYLTNDPDNPFYGINHDGSVITFKYGTLDEDLNFTEDLSVKDYLNVGSEKHSDSFKMLTIADYTVIVNRTKEVKYLNTLSQNYTITGVKQTILDVPPPWENEDYFSSSRKYDIGDYVKYTNRRMWRLVANPSSPSTQVAPDHANNADQQIWAKEGEYCETGDVYKISGDAEGHDVGFYAKYDGEVWQETLAPATKYKLDVSTMPHRLVRTGVNEFTFAPCGWGDRTVGDEEIVPWPSFVNKKITNITFFRNRLGFLAKESFVLSGAGDYFRMFPSTAIDVLADDPIDLIASSTRVVDLVSTCPFDKNLLVNSRQGQFMLGSGSGGLSPSTATLDPTTAYTTDDQSDPVGAGSNVYFVNPRNRYVSLMEYLIQPDTLTEDAADVTGHCPHYIPNGKIQMISVVPLDMIIIHSDGKPDSLFVYKYYWQGNDKPQSAWSEWEFDGDVHTIGLVNATLSITVERNGVTSFEQINLENAVDFGLEGEDNLDFIVNLDQQIRKSGWYNLSTNTTKIDLPYGHDIDRLKIIDPTNGYIMRIHSHSTNGKWVKILGDHTGKHFYIGHEYSAIYEFSEWYPKDDRGFAIVDAQLQVRGLTLSFEETGEFYVRVTPQGREPYDMHFSGIEVGSSVIGTNSMLTGEKKFAVLAKSKQLKVEIISDSYLPMKIISAAWEGFLVERSQRSR